MKRFINVIGLGTLILGAIVGALLLFGWFTQLLWNALMPGIFGLPEITLIQAIGLQILSTLLIRSHGTNGKKKG